MSETPEGFHVLRVLVTTKELVALRTEGAFTALGTPSAGLRVRAGLPETAYGLKAALSRHEGGGQGAFEGRARDDLQREFNREEGS